MEVAHHQAKNNNEKYFPNEIIKGKKSPNPVIIGSSKSQKSRSSNMVPRTLENEILTMVTHDKSWTKPFYI